MKLSVRNSASSLASLLVLFAFPINAFSSTTQHVTSCGTIISTSGTWVVDNDLTCSGDAIDVEVGQVTLKLQGHILTGPGGSGLPGGPDGVHISTAAQTGVKAVTVLGPGTITNFNDGVVFIGTDGGGAIGLTLTHNAFSGIICNSDFVNNVPSTGLMIAQNVITNGGKGIDCNGVTKSTIIGNTVDTNGFEGILLFVASYTTVSGNFSNGNADGIVLGSNVNGSSATSNTIEGNMAVGNTDIGINARSNSSKNHYSGNNTFANSVLDISEFNSGCVTDSFAKDVFSNANQTCVK